MGMNKHMMKFCNQYYDSSTIYIYIWYPKTSFSSNHDCLRMHIFQLIRRIVSQIRSEERVVCDAAAFSLVTNVWHQNNYHIFTIISSFSYHYPFSYHFLFINCNVIISQRRLIYLLIITINRHYRGTHFSFSNV